MFGKLIVIRLRVYVFKPVPQSGYRLCCAKPVPHHGKIRGPDALISIAFVSFFGAFAYFSVLDCLIVWGYLYVF
jgi:hypothetical protein